MLSTCFPVDYSQSRVPGCPELYSAVVWGPSISWLHISIKKNLQVLFNLYNLLCIFYICITLCRFPVLVQSIKQGDILRFLFEQLF